jgi:replicative DNA helicase
MHLVNSEMFTDPYLSEIFSLYQHAEGKEINQLVILPRIVSDVMSEQAAIKYLADIINEHESGISDRSCEESIYNAYRVRKFEEFINRTRVSPQNIDETISDFKETLEGLTKKAESKPRTLSDLTDYKNNYFVEKRKSQFRLGFAKIDKAIGGLDNGDVIIIAARPGVGKSAFSLQMIRKFGRDGYRVGYFNLEMAEKQIYERSIAAASGIDMTRIRLATNFLNDEKEKFEKGNEILSKETNVTTFTGTQTINSIRAIQKQNGFQIIVIDYLQLIQSTSRRNNRVSEVGDISRGLKAIATDFNIPVIALSQLNRASEMNKDKEPTMSELRESGDIEQDASVILMIWNPNAEDLTEKKIKVEKSRNGYVERETLYFDGKHMTFSTIDINDGFRESNDEDDVSKMWS